MFSFRSVSYLLKTPIIFWFLLLKMRILFLTNILKKSVVLVYLIKTKQFWVISLILKVLREFYLCSQWYSLNNRQYTSEVIF